MNEYIKRTWKDGEPITAEKLNNLETGVAEAKKADEQLRLFIEQEGVKTAVGTYSGTGETTHTLTFDFNPKFVIIEEFYQSNKYHVWLHAIRGNTTLRGLCVPKSGGGAGAYATPGDITLTWGDKTLTLKCTAVAGTAEWVVMNQSGLEYRYFAIG